MNTINEGATMELATILLPVYAPDPCFLKEAISSICLQSIDKNYFSVIVCFDGPHPNELIEFTERCFFNNITNLVISTDEKVGLTGVLNHMLARVSTPYFVRIDSDDIMHPERLKYQLNALIKNNYDLCGSRVCMIDEQSNILPSARFQYPTSDFLIRLVGSIYNNPIAHPAVSGRVDCLSALGYYSQSPPFEDYHLWSRYSKDKSLQNLPQSLLYYRVHPSQITSQHIVPYKQLVAIRVQFLWNFLLKYPFAIIILPLLFMVACIPLNLFRSK